MYATNEQKAVIIKACGEPAVILYEFYLSKANEDTYVHTDKKNARVFGWTIAKARVVRLKLEKAGWFKHIKTRNSTYSITAYFLGLVKVLEYKIETSKPQMNVQQVVDVLDGLSVKYSDKKKHPLLKRWLKAGYIDLSVLELQVFKSDAMKFVDQYYLA